MGATNFFGGVGAVLLGAVVGCGPIETRNTVVIEQPKPLEVNVNLSGRLELVITDARKDMEAITGAKAKRVVNPEDIGLPAAGVPGALAPVTSLEGSVVFADVLQGGNVRGGVRATAVASEDQLVASMAARNGKVRELLTAKVAGEAHTGLLAARGSLSADQKGTLEAENADRGQLYALRAAKNGTTVEAAALAYYLQRLGYAEKGDWVEKYNKGSKQWEWIEWAG